MISAVLDIAMQIILFLMAFVLVYAVVVVFIIFLWVLFGLGVRISNLFTRRSKNV